jgi:hypothetical protein
LGGLQSGGGTSAVAASAHSGCERFRLTDPFLTGKTRWALADHIGHPDTSATIPEARWMRAMTFERLVQDTRFVSELLTKAVGQLGLPRPAEVHRRDCHGVVESTRIELAAAHARAEAHGKATMLTAMAVPYPGLEDAKVATPVFPDFGIVCPPTTGDGGGSWLVMGDAKDYERVRARIDDARMLKGFLQVALGAEGAATWSALPAGMRVHAWGVLAVPRNAFLQPEAVAERLDDHREEVRARASERLAARAELGPGAPTEDELGEYVAHLTSTFDPGTCASCNLFAYCREELRTDDDPLSLLTEIGVPRHQRGAVADLVSGGGEIGQVPQALVDQVAATVTGLPQWNARRRVDPCGREGTVNLVIVKSDSAVLGIHGIALQSVGAGGPGPWMREVFPDPQSPSARRRTMRLLGTAIRDLQTAGLNPIHIVVPDRPTVDLLATMADSLAGVELSRLRWQHDHDSGRTPLTFDGEPATIPDPLHEDERLAVSFLLEEDRARAMSLRTPVVALRDVLAGHLAPGGPAVDAGRLDYLVTWAEAESPLDHRAVSDAIADSVETPGARLSNIASDAIHGARRDGDHTRYDELVNAALEYRKEVLERALAVLQGIPDSRLRSVHRRLEADAQDVWNRRVRFQASDLVRFSRMSRFWRNVLVSMLDGDRTCADQLTCMADASVAHDKATDAGSRELALADVLAVSPLRLDVRSRRLVTGSEVVALHINGEPVVEQPSTTLKIQKGSFKFGQLPIGPLRDHEAGGLLWEPKVDPGVKAGDVLVLADVTWFDSRLKSGHELKVKRPGVDTQAAPKDSCTIDSFTHDPEGHKWCCRPHSVAEAEWADELAARRAEGKLNPDVWPPLVDEERFDIGVPSIEVPIGGQEQPPDHLTTDDID